MRTKYPDKVSGWNIWRMPDEKEVGGGCCSLGSLLRPTTAPAAECPVWVEPPADSPMVSHQGGNRLRRPTYPQRRKFRQTAYSEGPSYLRIFFLDQWVPPEKKTLPWQNRKGSLFLLKLGRKVWWSSSDFALFHQDNHQPPYNQLWAIAGDTIVSPLEKYPRN